MLDRWLEPDSEELRCECGECDECTYDPMCDFEEDCSIEKDIQIALHNYECMLYNEPQNRTWRNL